MIHRAEDIAHVASATVARWQAEALAIVQARQAASCEGLDFEKLAFWTTLRKQEQQGRA